jgi:hypothetical protein
MNSMILKIRNFLSKAGFDEEVAPDLNDIDQVRQFEATYGLSILGMLEQEWVAEQVEKDVTSGTFEVFVKAPHTADE